MKALIVFILLLSFWSPDKSSAQDLVLSSPMTLEQVAQRNLIKINYITYEQYLEKLMVWNNHLPQGTTSSTYLPSGTGLYLHAPSSPFVSGSRYQETLRMGEGKARPWRFNFGPKATVRSFKQTYQLIEAASTQVSFLSVNGGLERIWNQTVLLNGELGYRKYSPQSGPEGFGDVDLQDELEARLFFGLRPPMWNAPSYAMIGIGHLSFNRLNFEIVNSPDDLESRKISALMAYLGWSYRRVLENGRPQSLTLYFGMSPMEETNPSGALFENLRVYQGSFTIRTELTGLLSFDCSIDTTQIRGENLTSYMGGSLGLSLLF